MEKKKSPITRVKVGPITYKVEVVKNLLDDDGKHFYGMVNYRDNIIFLDEAEPQTMTQTLFHEIFHAMFHGNGIDEKDEIKLDTLATGIYSLLLDNPKLREL